MHKLNQARLNAINFGKKLGYVAGSLVVAAPTFAAIDTAAITSTISDVVTAAGVVGAAALAMHYGIKAYKWLRSAG